ncbi:hypothetical protein ALC56_08502 [Trachymyrmex septentrionalis]|uniref:Uncharacterized protein n=1 Tax=Trachymyrmex septentrionalis TaxID=34720 RepID=A0A195F8K8_9HYME|nr:hypothetical protein ALC56_08502 [Trachymyrmex septentrionalis]
MPATYISKKLPSGNKAFCILARSNDVGIFRDESSGAFTRRSVRYVRLLSPRKNRPACVVSTDGGIRLINISVDSGPDSCRDEKLAKFRVMKEGRKESERSLQNLLTYGPFFLHRTLQSG